MNDLVVLTPWDLALAALLLIIPAAISIALKLGLEKRLGIASVRTVVQLAFIGVVLEWVFELNRWYYVVPVLLVMLLVAARAAIQRSERRFPGAYLAAFGSLVLASSVTAFSVTEVVIGVEPWYAPRYVIPLIGMLLGNGLNGISLGLDRLLNDLVQKRRAVEARLALGASSWQAIQPWMRDAVRSGMVPIINSMMIVGLVSLPGMMTGQILAGAAPINAVAYQILIMFMIAAATALGVIMLCLLCYKVLAHPEHRIRWERIVSND
ncbi:iron export ABC transporter permease subunit FetB [Persicimonas caeni]|uniref:Iron export ABC transporter permease subunit FetB n=1 Tax=Persicimonas caeni TaxID=2292766 RepID=A0A4Y6PQN3_PERCE|nr:iron export ABC transporter permease subunit FetB [Persicimonas caeni]QDG50638.1 iron export ABC transporter permease subunit FetB [Persicimonas caeni]QED31859.1 iron export ABC transporter permease subunit FetB [Persicimonas caeni]